MKTTDHRLTRVWKITPLLLILALPPLQAQEAADPDMTVPAESPPDTPSTVAPPRPTSRRPRGMRRPPAPLPMDVAPPTPSAPFESAAPPTSDGGIPNTGGLIQPGEKGKVRLDFNQADISQVAKAISELTGRNFLLDERINGRVTLISPTAISVEEAYQAFISALEVKGFTVVRYGRMYKIVPLRDMKSMPIPTDVSGDAGGADSFVTRLIPVKYIKAAEIVKALRGLISKNGDMTSYDPTNMLIITDSVANLRRVAKIIERLDQQGFEESLEVIKLKYAPATDTADKLRKIFNVQEGMAPGAPATPGGTGEREGGTEFISRIIPDERTNSLIVMANKEGISRVRQVVTKIDASIQEEVGKGRIHVHYLQYADAGDLAGTLASLTGGSRGTSAPRSGRNTTTRRTPTPSGFTQLPGQAPAFTPPPPAGGGGGPASLELFGGDIHITSDIPTNSLVITASAADYEALLPVIRRLDIRRSQAFIEAMILEVDIDKAFDVGVAMNAAGNFGSDPTTVFGATGFGGLSSIAPPAAAANLSGLIAGVRGKTLDIDIGNGESLSVPIYGATLRALQSNGTINVLSTPNILTSDNIEAEIVVGQEVPFVTSQGRDINNQPINQIQREDVAITLRVTPQINESDDITLDIFQEIKDLIPGPDIQQYGPATSKRSAKTTVLVRDGQTVTVGGLISERETNSISKVPVLGDIPLLGWFFKSKSKRKSKTSLVIFITPHIIHTPEDLQETSIAMNQKRQRFLKENNTPENTGLRKYDLDKELRMPLPPSKEIPTESTVSPVEDEGPAAEETSP